MVINQTIIFMSDSNPKTWKEHVNTVLDPDEQAKIKRDLDEQNEVKPLNPLQKLVREVIIIIDKLL
jgi:hypothetical protein